MVVASAPRFATAGFRVGLCCDSGSSRRGGLRSPEHSAGRFSEMVFLTGGHLSLVGASVVFATVANCSGSVSDCRHDSLVPVAAFPRFPDRSAPSASHRMGVFPTGGRPSPDPVGPWLWLAALATCGCSDPAATQLFQSLRFLDWDRSALSPSIRDRGVNPYRPHSRCILVRYLVSMAALPTDKVEYGVQISMLWRPLAVAR